MKKPLIPVSADADVHYFTTQAQFQARYAEVSKDRLEFERYIGETNRHRRHLYNVKKVLQLFNIRSNISSWSLPGFCQACARPTRFRCDWRVSDKRLPNYSLGMECEHCGTIGRNRFIAHTLRELYAQHSGNKPFRLHLFEQTTPFFRNIRSFLNDAEISGSDFLGFQHESGKTIRGIRHENMEATSFADKTFDCICSIDVLEHVPNVSKALLETYRILKPGGVYIFTTPVFIDSKETVQRAIMENGQIRHIQPPVYHGDPAVNPLLQFLDPSRGVLVYNDFGWDILKMLKTAGFRECYIIGYYSVLYGYLGRHGCGAMEFALIAKK